LFPEDKITLNIGRSTG